MTEVQVREYLGSECIEREEINGRIIISYSLGALDICNGPDYQEFLLARGLPVYYAAYTFEHGRLIRVVLSSDTC